MIFKPTSTELAAFYGSHVDNTTIKALATCHQYLEDNTAAMLHLTTSLDAIVASGKLVMSAGGLAGCLYGTPVYANGKIHNLGAYLQDQELPMFLRNQQRTAPIKSILAVPSKSKVGCLDYLSFGEQYLEAYRLLPALHQSIPLANYEKLFAEHLAMAMALHKTLSTYHDIEHSIASIERAVQASPIIRMLYFEIILEYVFLFQNDRQAMDARRNNQLYNAHAKTLVFALNPQLATRFSLKHFNASPRDISAYLVQKSNDNDVIVKFVPNHFYDYLIKRMAFYVNHYLLADVDNFRGHILFRCFDQRLPFEVFVAQKAWQEAKANGYNMVTYRLPKGEVGLLPNNETSFYHNNTELDLKLSPSLATTATAMRDPYNNPTDDCTKRQTL